MDQLLDRLKEALSRLLAEAESFALTVESLLNSFSKKLSILTAEALGHVKHVGSFLNEFSESLSSRLTELPGFLPPVAQQLSIPMLGGLILTVLFLLLVLWRSRRATRVPAKNSGKRLPLKTFPPRQRIAPSRPMLTQVHLRLSSHGP